MKKPISRLVSLARARRGPFDTGGAPGERQIRQAQHRHHLGRRHRPVQPQRLYQRPDGLPHAQHRLHRQGRDDFHRLLRRAKLHRRPLGLHHRPERLSHRPGQGRPARRRRRAEQGRSDHRRTSEDPGLRDRAVRQEPSWRQGRDPADRRMASTSSTAISTTSTPRRSRSFPTIRRPDVPEVRPAWLLQFRPPTGTTTVDPHFGRSASRRSRTPAR